MDLFNSIIPSFFAENGLWSFSNGAILGNAYLADRVWVANRCIQLNSQQISSMPIRFNSNAPTGGREPAWLNSPDPNLYPNGIADALFAIVSQMYGWGFACLYITDLYEDFYPRRWTVLASEHLNVKFDGGRREYKYGEDLLDARRVIQIDRNPSHAATGTSALRAYAQQAYGLLAAGNQSMKVNTGGVPPGYIKSIRKLDSGQAVDISEQWDAGREAGRTPVFPPELDWVSTSFDPKDMALLDTQEFNAKAIATAFGVPSVLLNMALQGGLTYQNPAALGEMWWRFELRPTATRIANALTAQALPAGNWVSFDAADTFLPLDEMSEEDDTQLSQVAKASPVQQPATLQAIGGGA
jgi:HK97 family phage portal protein